MKEECVSAAAGAAAAAARGSTAFFTDDLAGSVEDLDGSAALGLLLLPTAAGRGNRVPSARFLNWGGTTTEERRWRLASMDANRSGARGGGASGLEMALAGAGDGAAEADCSEERCDWQV